AVAVNFFPKNIYPFFSRGLRIAAVEIENIDHRFRHHDLDHRLSPSRRRYAANGVIGVRTAADEGRIADAPGMLLERATGGRADTDIAMTIHRDGADSIARRLLRAEGLFARLLQVLALFPEIPLPVR